MYLVLFCCYGERFAFGEDRVTGLSHRVTLLSLLSLSVLVASISMTDWYSIFFCIYISSMNWSALHQPVGMEASLACAVPIYLMKSFLMALLLRSCVLVFSGGVIFLLRDPPRARIYTQHLPVAQTNESKGYACNDAS